MVQVAIWYSVYIAILDFIAVISCRFCDGAHLCILFFLYSSIPLHVVSHSYSLQQQSVMLVHVHMYTLQLAANDSCFRLFTTLMCW